MTRPSAGWLNSGGSVQSARIRGATTKVVPIGQGLATAFQTARAADQIQVSPELANAASLAPLLPAFFRRMLPHCLLVIATGVTSSRRSRRARWTVSRASVLTRSPGRLLQLARRRHLTTDPRRSQHPVQGEPGRARLITHRHRARQGLDPRPDVLRRGGQPGLDELARDAVDRCRRARPCVHVEPHARTLDEHRGLPQLSDRPSRRPLLGNPRTCVSEAPARNHPAPRAVTTYRLGQVALNQVARPRSFKGPGSGVLPVSGLPG